MLTSPKYALKILLIEDDHNDAYLIEKALTSDPQKVTVEKAEKLSSALELIQDFQFDVVLLDIGLPDCVGLGSLQSIQASAPHLPIIVLTGRSDDELATEAISLGAQDYFLKEDLNSRAIYRCIRYAIHRKKAIGDLERSHDELMHNVRKHESELSVFETKLRAQMEEKQVTEGALISSNEQLRELAAHLQSIREEERTGIAREIHDELGQILTALKMDLVWMRNRIDDKQQVLEKIHTDVGMIDSTIASIKRLITELRPAILDNLGLEAALEWQAEEFERRTGIKCEVEINMKEPVVDKEMKTALFRIFQEVLTNVLRHACATKVKAVLKDSGGEIALSVQDNGGGIEEEQMSKPSSFGLIGMRERVYPWGGWIQISGKKHVGTTVTAFIPVKNPVG